MAEFLAIFWEMAILSFLALLFYFYQRRKILSPKKPQEMMNRNEWSDFLLQLHTFLDENQNAPFYEEANDFALELENAYINQDMPIFSQKLLQIFDLSELPALLKEQLRDLLQRL